MFQTISIVGRVSGYANAASHIVGYAELTFPEVGIDGFILIEAKHTNGDTAILKVTFSYEFFLGCLDFNNFSFLGFSVEVCDGTGKHPRVETF